LTVDPHSTQIRVRYAETDQMGVVHHSVYPIWFEAARSEFFRDHNLPYASFEEEGILLMVTHLECRFLRPAYYDQLVEVAVLPRYLTPVRCQIDYVIRDEDMATLATGLTRHAFVNRDGRPINLKKTRFWQPLSALIPHEREFMPNS
jgi:acyl-CoA thioester hydrolase